MEKWKDVNIYGRKLKISSLGNICSVDYYTKGRNNSKRFIRGRKLKTRNNLGYNILSILDENRKIRTVRVHRLVAVGFMGINYHDKIDIDHINGIRNDNRLENLRLVNMVQNTQNARKASNRSSKYKGVCYAKNRNKFVANIRANNKNIYLGEYKKETDAAIAYNNAAKKYFGEYARLNVLA